MGVLLLIKELKYTDVSEYLCCQETSEVNLGHHLTAAITLALVRMLMIFYQVPQLGARLLVWSDHGCSRPQAVRTAGGPQQTLCIKTR